MRLYILLPHLRTGGIEVGLVRLAPYLKERGLNVSFILQNDDGDLRDKLAGGVEVVALNSGGMLSTARAFARHLRQAPCDVVYTATNAMNIAQLIAGRLVGRDAPMAVVGEHIPLDAFLATRKRPWFRRFAMQATYGRAVGIVAPIQPILDEHRTLLGANCPPVHVLHNPVIDAVSPARPLSETARKFVSLGRLSPEKGFDLALHVMASYRQHDSHASLTIYGEGPERAALEALSANLGLQDVVTFAGRTEDVAGVLTQADLFLCTSKVEGFGNAIVEAQAAGVPVLSVDCPFGPRLLLQDGAAGALEKTRDPDVIAQTLACFAHDRPAREAARTQGQIGASAYSIESSANMHAAYFKSLKARSE